MLKFLPSQRLLNKAPFCFEDKINAFLRSINNLYLALALGYNEPPLSAIISYLPLRD